jgi:hypothetical protein
MRDSLDQVAYYYTLGFLVRHIISASVTGSQRNKEVKFMTDKESNYENIRSEDWDVLQIEVCFDKNKI